MGDLTRAELRGEVEANLGRLNIASDDITDARYNTNLHLAQIRIARARNWIELRQDTTDSVTIAGTPATDKYYTVPSDIKHIFSVRLTYDSETRPPLIYVPQRQWDQYVPLAEEKDTERPTHYTRWQRRIEFWRVPGANFTLLLRWIKWPDDFADDSDTSDLTQKDDIIIAHTTSTMLRQTGKAKAAGEYYAIYAALLKEAKDNDATNPDLSLINRRVGDGTSDGWPGTDYWADPFVR